MSRTLVKTCRWVSLLVGMACLMAVPVQSVPLVATPATTPKRVFKVCLLLLESQKNPSGAAKYWNPDPWILPVLNRSPYKPAGWILDNPLAPGKLLNDADLIKSGTYYAMDSKGNGQNWYINGKAPGGLTPGVSAIGKDDPAYWVVKLDQKSVDALAQFDLVIVNGHSISALSNSDRNNLQLLLSHGATIWLNNSQRQGNQLTNFFVDPPITMHQGPYIDTTNNANLACVDPDSWLINGYYSLTDYEVQYLKDNLSENSYITGGFGGLFGEVVRLYSNNLPYPNGGKPAIIAGRVGAGQLVVTGTDVIGATSDWWEKQHNTSPAIWGANTLGIAPYFSTTKPDQTRTYVSCSKFFFNMLCRPSSWHMISGNVLSSRFYPQAFSTSLLRNWATPFTTLSEPVTFGNYVAVRGTSTVGSRIRVYRINDPTADSAMDAWCSLAPPTAALGYSWVGSPVLGRVIDPGNTTPRTVVYGLEAAYNFTDQSWYMKPHCFSLDTGTDRWEAVAGMAVPCTSGGIPSASMTLSNNRLVVTAFGRTINNSGNRIFILDATTGEVGAVVGADPGWGMNFRLTSPASIVTVPVDFQMTPVQSGDMRISGNGGMERRREMVELLAVTGEAYPAATGQSVLYLIPPLVVAKQAARGQMSSGAASTNPTVLSLQKGDDPATKIPIGVANSATNDFRRRNIVAIKATGTSINVLFRSFDAFVSQGPTAAKLSATSVKPLKLLFPRDGAAGPDVTLSVPRLSMGYPIVLHGTQQYPLSNRLSLRLNDGDGTSIFGYNVDAPPVVNGDEVIVNTNCAQQTGRPILNRARAQDIGQNLIQTPSDPRLMSNMAFGGTMTAYRVASPELTQVAFPAGRTTGDVSWQFFGDTFGPKGVGYSVMDGDNLPVLWHSDFPFPAAAGKDAIYAVGMFNNAYSGPLTGQMGPQLAVNNCGMLYALDSAPSRYLQQVVTAGAVVGTVADNYQLQVNQLVVGPLHVGARAILKYAGGTWDMGTITAIRGTVDANGVIIDPYTVTFDRLRPPAAIWNGVGGSLLIATTNPYVSHVQGWDTVSGAKPIVGDRVSQGICSTYTDDPAPPNPFDGHGEVMVSFTQLQSTCHDPDTYVGTTVTPPAAEAYPPANWKLQPYLYLPRVGTGEVQGISAASSAGGAYIQPKPVLNFIVDYRSGRIELSPENAGQYADRFVVVHYLTMETVGANLQQVHHAEIMHIPSQVKWQYQFTDAVPDSGPVVVNDTVYVSANRKVGTDWQPTIYAFAVHPENPLQVQPKWQQPVGPSATSNLAPYRGVTTPTPTANGILIGTALSGANGTGNQLCLFSDRGTLIADGHRLLRVDGDGQVTWQASATKDYDLAAQGDINPETKAAGLAQQDFTMISRIQRLKSGNILVCDTGGNRVVEMDRDGNTVWQYPDSDLMQSGNPTTPANLRLNGPRDVRRYEHDVTPPPGDPDFGVIKAVHWEITLIADTGNNRIIEVRRPYVKYVNILTQGGGFQYKPGLTIAGEPMKQAEGVIADGKTVKFDGAPLDATPSFTIARRCPEGATSADDNGLTDANWVLDRVRSKQVLAVIGNSVPDPVLKNHSLRTAMLLRADATVPLAVEPSASPTTNGANALMPRRGSQTDYINVRQLDLFTLTNGAGNPEIHALIVDQSGVREIALTDQAHPVFEMTQTEYATALIPTSWSGYLAMLSTDDQTKLNNWLTKNQLFAPAAVMRIDPGSKSTADQPNVRYVISQMNTLTSRDDGNRRIHLFEARYIGPPGGAYIPNDWGIIDASNNFYLYPNPLSPDYPNLPGTTYPLTQPLSIDRD